MRDSIKTGVKGYIFNGMPEEIAKAYAKADYCEQQFIEELLQDNAKLKQQYNEACSACGVANNQYKKLERQLKELAALINDTANELEDSEGRHEWARRLRMRLKQYLELINE